MSEHRYAIARHVDRPNTVGIMCLTEREEELLDTFVRFSRGKYIVFIEAIRLIHRHGVIENKPICGDNVHDLCKKLMCDKQAKQAIISDCYRLQMNDGSVQYMMHYIPL